MLALYLAERFERYAQNSHDTTFLEYYFDNQDDRRNTAMSLIRALIYQLVKQNPALIHYLLPRFKVQSDGLFAASSFESLWMCCESMLMDDVHASTYCIVDGLDECDPTSLPILLRRLTTLSESTRTKLLAPKMHLVLISREHPNSLLKELRLTVRIQLDQSESRLVHQDLELFITDRVEKLSEEGSYPCQLRSHVERVFRQRSQGTFLWVGLVAKELEEYTCDEIVIALERYPSGLDALYAHMLQQIPERRRSITNKILVWVVFAMRPLELEELGAGIDNLDDTVTGLDMVETTRVQVRNCGQILLIKKDQRQRETVHLVHQSAKDFLLAIEKNDNSELNSFVLKQQAGHMAIIQQCSKYLVNASSSTVLRSGLPDPVPDRLCWYARFYWHEHARHLSEQTWASLEPPCCFLSDETGQQAREAYLRGCVPFNMYSNHIYYKLITSTDPIIFACILRITTLLRYLVRNYEISGWPEYRSMSDTLTKQIILDSALCCAQDPCTAKLLIEAGASPNCHNHFGLTPLVNAARQKRTDLAQLLIDMGADVNLTDSDNRTPLYEATIRNDMDMMDLLLRDGANPDLRYLHMTPLSTACWIGNKQAMLLLLERGADPDRTYRARTDEQRLSRGSPLSIAVVKNRVAMVRKLLRYGANPSLKEGFSYCPFMYAVLRGYDGVVQAFQDFDVSANFVSRGHRQFWRHAEGRGHLSTLRLLQGYKHLGVEDTAIIDRILSKYDGSKKAMPCRKLSLNPA